MNACPAAADASATTASCLSKRAWHFGARFWCGLGVVWCGLAILVWSFLLKHTYRPMPTAAGVTSWPDETGVLKSNDTQDAVGRFRIVVFVHPLCPCTRATLHKFDESLTRLPGDTAVSVVFVIAGLKMSDVIDSDNVAFARRLPGVEVRFDATGDESRRFGASVSGEVFAFNRQGCRVFHGGVTSGRGHEDASVGQRHLERLAAGFADEAYTGPVFGCALPAGGSDHCKRAFTEIEKSVLSTSADGA